MMLALISGFAYVTMMLIKERSKLNLLSNNRSNNEIEMNFVSKGKNSYEPPKNIF